MTNIILKAGPSRLLWAPGKSSNMLISLLFRQQTLAQWERVVFISDFILLTAVAAQSRVWQQKSSEIMWHGRFFLH